MVMFHVIGTTKNCQIWGELAVIVIVQCMVIDQIFARDFGKYDDPGNDTTTNIPERRAQGHHTKSYNYEYEPVCIVLQTDDFAEVIASTRRMAAFTCFVEASTEYPPGTDPDEASRYFQDCLAKSGM